MKTFWVLALMAVTWATASVVSADVLMISENEDLGSKTVYLHKTSLSSKAMKVEIQGKNRETVFIYRKDKALFWMIEPKDKSYVEMTKEDLEAMYRKMDDAFSQMEAQMKDMSPAQRAMIEKMMKKSQGSKSGSPEELFKKVKSGVKIGRWICDQYEGSLGGNKTEDIWTAGPKALGLTPSDFAVMSEMGDFFKQFAKTSSSFFKVDGSGKTGGFRGVPVKVVMYDGGKASFQTRLKEVKKQNFGASVFEVPDGFTKKESPLKALDGE